MNFKNFLLAIITVAIVTVSGTELPSKPLKASISALEKSNAEYTYIRVFKDDIWWIYVYDGNILIDAYPEDGG